MFRRSSLFLVPMMKCAVFKGKGRIELDEKPIPTPKEGEALVKITTTTICGSDIHIRKGTFPVKEGLTIGHEPIAVIESLGSGVHGFKKGQRVVVATVSPCGSCENCLSGCSSRCGGPQGGIAIGVNHDGAQAEYMTVPYAQANMYPAPEGLSDEQLLMCPDILSTGMNGPEIGKVKIGDIVVIFAQGPVGLCATVGARLMGATTIITVDGVEERLAMSKKMGADITLNFNKCDPVEEVMKLTGGRGTDVAIECLGTSATFESCLRCIKLGGTLSSVGVYNKDLKLPMDAFAFGVGNHTIVTGVCPGAAARMRRMVNVVESGRVDLTPMVTHRFKLDQIEEAYDLFAAQRDGVIKVAITP